MHETSGTCRSKLSLSATFIKLLTYLKFEPVNTFMHNCDIFYIIIYANLCSYYVNQTCDEIEIGITNLPSASGNLIANFPLVMLLLIIIFHYSSVANKMLTVLLFAILVIICKRK